MSGEHEHRLLFSISHDTVSWAACNSALDVNR